MLGLRFICPPQGASAAEYRSGSLRSALRARPAAFAGSRLRPRFCVVSAGGFFHLRSIHAGCVSQRQRPQTVNRPEGTALPLRRLLWATGSFSLCHIHYRKLTLFFRQPLSAEDIAGNHGSREISPLSPLTAASENNKKRTSQTSASRTSAPIVKGSKKNSRHRATRFCKGQ